MKNLTDEKPTRKPFGNVYGRAIFVDDGHVKGKNILDMGCGFGWCEINFLDRGAKHITGMDISSDVLKTAKKHIKDKKVMFLRASATKLPFKDNRFDTVVAWEVVEHIPKGEEVRMFSEVARVLKKGGRFYLSTPYSSFRSKLTDPAWWLIGHRHYKLSQIKNFASKAGLKVEFSRVQGGKFSIIHSWSMYLSKWLFRRPTLFEDKIKDSFTAEYGRGERGYMYLYVCLRRVKQE